MYLHIQVYRMYEGTMYVCSMYIESTLHMYM